MDVQFSRRRAQAFVLTAIASTLLWTTQASEAQLLTLFPGAPQQIVDGGGGDQDNTINGTIVLSNAPMPDWPTNANSPFTISGDVVSNYVGPTNVQAGLASVTITNAVIKNTNTTGFDIIGSTPGFTTDYINMLEFVFFPHGPLGSSGSISVTIDGSVQQPGNNPPAPFVPNSNDIQHLRVGGSDTSFSGSSDFAIAHAFRTAPNTTLIPDPIFDTGSVSGTFSGGGTLQLHIDDALTLGPNDELVLPTSIELVATGSIIPEPTALLLLTSVLLWGAHRRVAPRFA